MPNPCSELEGGADSEDPARTLHGHRRLQVHPKRVASACLHVVPDGDSSFAHGTTRAASLLVAAASVEGDCFGVAARDGPTFRPPDSVQRTAQHRSIETLPPLMALAAEAVQCSLLHTQNTVTPTSRPWNGMVEARRSVTAGHGMVTAGRPVLRHGWSRRRGSGHGSHDAGPAAQASTARHTGVARSRTLACATEVAVHVCGTCRQARLSRPSLSRRGQTSAASLVTYRSRRWSRASRDPEVASSFQNVPRPTRSAAGQ